MPRRLLWRSTMSATNSEGSRMHPNLELGSLDFFVSGSVRAIWLKATLIVASFQPPAKRTEHVLMLNQTTRRPQNTPSARQGRPASSGFHISAVPTPQGLRTADSSVAHHWLPATTKLERTRQPRIVDRWALSWRLAFHKGHPRKRPPLRA